MGELNEAGLSASSGSGWRHCRSAGGSVALLLALLVSACTAADDAAEVPPGRNVADSASGESTGVRAAAPGERVDSVPVALFAGTSLTAGLGLDPEEAYPAVLQRMADSAGLQVRVVNGGLSGETSAGLVRRIPWLLRQPADLVVIETGANDGLRGLNVDSTRANLTRVVEAVRTARPDARVLLVQMEAPPNLGSQYTTRFREMFPAVAEETGAALVPFLLEGVAGERSLNQPDGIHPNEEGARMVARTVWPSFAAAVAEVSSEWSADVGSGPGMEQNSEVSSSVAREPLNR